MERLPVHPPAALSRQLTPYPLPTDAISRQMLPYPPGIYRMEGSLDSLRTSLTRKQGSTGWTTAIPKMERRRVFSPWHWSRYPNFWIQAVSLIGVVDLIPGTFFNEIAKP